MKNKVSDYINDVIREQEVDNLFKGFYHFGAHRSELSEKDRKGKESKCKRMLNTIAVEKMNIDRIKERNGLDEMQSWFNALH